MARSGETVQNRAMPARERALAHDLLTTHPDVMALKRGPVLNRPQSGRWDNERACRAEQRRPSTAAESPSKGAWGDIDVLRRGWIAELDPTKPKLTHHLAIAIRAVRLRRASIHAPKLSIFLLTDADSQQIPALSLPAGSGRKRSCGAVTKSLRFFGHGGREGKCSCLISESYRARRREFTHSLTALSRVPCSKREP